MTTTISCKIERRLPINALFSLFVLFLAFVVLPPSSKYAILVGLTFCFSTKFLAQQITRDG